jgi:hypothetical protein
MPRAARLAPQAVATIGTEVVPALGGRQITVKQARFVEAFLACGDASRAYLAAYATKTKVSARWVVTEAYRLLRHPLVRARLAELRRKTETLATFTADQAFCEAGEAFELAKHMGNPAAMVSAVTLRARLAGHLVDRREVKQVTDEQQLSDEELEQRMQKAAREAGYEIRRLAVS